QMRTRRLSFTASTPRGVRRDALARADLDDEPDSSWIGRAPGRRAGRCDPTEDRARRASTGRREASLTGTAAAVVRGHRTRRRRGRRPGERQYGGSDRSPGRATAYSATAYSM